MSGSVSAIDTATNTVVGTVPVGSGPVGVAVNPAGTRVYVANTLTNNVSVVDAASNAVVATVAMGCHPYGVAANPAGTRVYVTNSDCGNVSAIDTATNTVVATVQVGSTPTGVAVNPAGTRVYVGNTDSRNVSIIDTATNTVVATVFVGTAPSSVAVTPAGTRVYVINPGSGNVSVIDAANNTIVATVAVSAAISFGQFIRPAAAVADNYQGLWWKSDEPYWGVNLAHQGDQIFATWYTYDTSGNAYWLSMLADRTPATSNSYKGDVNVSVGPPFNNFAGKFAPTKVGDATITFSDANNGSFFYQVTAGGATNVQQTKPITRYSLGGAQPTCTYATAPNLAAATNYQDLWWTPGEDGWGVNFAHQGDQLFATWYTYDQKNLGLSNPPMWLSALMPRQGTTNVFTGPLKRTSGPRFDNYKASDVVQPIPTVGTATVTFTDGNHATFAYTIDGTDGLPVVTNQSKSITRYLFVGPAGTTCQ